VDYRILRAIFVETPSVVILSIAVGFSVVTITLFDIKEAEIIYGFAMLLRDSLVWLEGSC
jgi:hypothetical protein